MPTTPAPAPGCCTAASPTGQHCTIPLGVKHDWHEAWDVAGQYLQNPSFNANANFQAAWKDGHTASQVVRSFRKYANMMVIALVNAGTVVRTAGNSASNYPTGCPTGSPGSPGPSHVPAVPAVPPRTTPAPQPAASAAAKPHSMHGQLPYSYEVDEFDLLPDA